MWMLLDGGAAPFDGGGLWLEPAPSPGTSIRARAISGPLLLAQFSPSPHGRDRDPGTSSVDQKTGSQACRNRVRHRAVTPRPDLGIRRRSEAGAVALLTGSDIRLQAASREALDGMFNRARTYCSASSNAVRPARFQGMFMAIAFDHARRLEDIYIGLEEVSQGMQRVG
jgi:hypothetical protein